MEEKYWIIAHDKPGLLIAMMKLLAGNAHISFEGNLSRCDFGSISGTSTVETEVLKKNTIYPKQDFIILPLESTTIQAILDIVIPEGKVVHEIIHIQIGKNDNVEFGAYDNFHPDCIMSGPAIPESLLKDLLSKRIITSYEAINKEV